MAGALRGDHEHVDAGGRLRSVEVDVEAVREGERLAVGHVLGDVLVVDALLLVSGASSMITSAHAAASPVDMTREPGRVGLGGRG